MDSETFGVEIGYGTQAIEWMNDEAKKMGWKFEARLYNCQIQTKNFGSFEMFSLIGDPKAAREITMRASKRFKIKVIEGGYKTRKFLAKIAKNEYGVVKKGDRVIGQIEFESSRFSQGEWKITKEERK
ncbi:hypothetical protein [Candidatus Nitrosotalea okcheonensis]|uniref:Uncharacterized protein n=1 Tax=Candidatus Nitrosotalea okcheonensis TaxID=1903276 RepID=A0A2H1FD03_9ARCH|nr:hypothetical protein [Candidatus Nitrosotalea okcheonensis]MDE1728520.1 hypothetical protein [Nitrososphaerota archaeon]MDE1831027.1 hypothetical protein [Nitrososphaerota archaeon]MDE1840656.1 hypothetical protein [Nitrososphaerota archaeon]MDE1877753.1 hypothetical protein [Nitrososphaerota archaeon]SMH70640.1 conserved protein of unknown function [Candidatus Nitrosotalea okcheonensis]